MDFITDFLDCFCGLIMAFIAWDPKIAMMTFLLIGTLIGRNQGASETQTSYSNR
jgi:hypothetical protein